MTQNFDPKAFVIGMVVIICSIALHEFGHAYSADRLGDPGPRRDGRVTLWPDRHFDPVGFLMIVVTRLTGFGIGWGKPVMVNPGAFKNPRRDMMIVTACGPLMNLILALISGLIIRYSISTGHTLWLTDRSIDPFNVDRNSYIGSFSILYNFANFVPNAGGQFLETFLVTNLGLMFFNLIPIPPLDGSKILWALLPGDLANQYARLMSQFGMMFLIMLLLVGSRTGLLTQPIMTSTKALIGIHEDIQ